MATRTIDRYASSLLHNRGCSRPPVVDVIRHDHEPDGTPNNDRWSGDLRCPACGALTMFDAMLLDEFLEKREDAGEIVWALRAEEDHAGRPSVPIADIPSSGGRVLLVGLRDGDPFPFPHACEAEGKDILIRRDHSLASVIAQWSKALDDARRAP